MNNDQYIRFEQIVRPAIHAAVARLHGELKSMLPDGSTLSPLEDVDHDSERGVGFTVNAGDDLRSIVVEMMLTDGDERGFDDEAKPGEPACGILMSVIGPSGLYLGEFSPGNRTPEAGSADPAELVRRVGLLDATQGAFFIIRCIDNLGRKRDTPGRSQ